MSIDLTKPRTQYRFNVACHRSDWTSPHLFKTRWNDLREEEAKQLFGILCQKFPESQDFYVTAETRTLPPRVFTANLDWHPKQPRKKVKK